MPVYALERFDADRQRPVRLPTQWAYTQHSTIEGVFTRVRDGGVWVAIVQTRAIDRGARRGLHTKTDWYAAYNDEELAMLNRRIVVCRLRRDDVSAAHPAWREAHDWTRTSRAQIVRAIEEGTDTLVPLADDVLSTSGFNRAEVEEVEDVWRRFCDSRESVLRIAPVQSVEMIHRLARAGWMTHAHTRWDSWRINGGRALHFNGYFVPQIATGLTEGDAVTDCLQVGLWTHPDYSPIRWGVLPAGAMRYTGATQSLKQSHVPVPYLVSEVRLDGADEAYCFYPAEPPRESFWFDGETRVASWFSGSLRSIQTTVKAIKDACSTTGIVLTRGEKKRASSGKNRRDVIKFVVLNFFRDGGGSVQRVDDTTPDWRVFPGNCSARLALSAEYLGACLHRRSGAGPVTIAVGEQNDAVRFTFKDGTTFIVAPMNIREGEFGVRL